MHTFLTKRSVWGTYLVEGGLWLMLMGLAVSRAAMSAGMGLALLGCLFQVDIQSMQQQGHHRPWLWGAIGFGAWHIIGALQGGLAGQSLWFGSWLPFLALIVGLGTLPRLSPLIWYRLMWVFVLAVSTTALLMLLMALGQAVQSGNWTGEAFSYVALTEPIGHHPTYFGLLLNLCLPTLYSLYRRPGRKSSTWLWAGAVLALGLFQGLLAARMQILIFGATLLILVWLLIRQRLPQLWWVVGLSLLGTAFILWQQPFVQQRFTGLMEWQEYESMEELPWNGVAVRLYLWETTWDLIQQQPWTGVGLGEGQTHLQKTFMADGFPNAGMNGHNQYLHTLLELGLPGLLLLLAWWMLPLFFPRPNTLRFFPIVCFIMLASGLTEVIFTRQWGLVAGTLFMVLPLAHQPEDSDEVGEKE